MKRVAYGLLLLLASLSSVTASADNAQRTWPDTPLARTQTLALLETLNADLLSHDSATLTLERWCGVHQMASPAKVVAIRVQGADKPLPADMRTQLGVDTNEPVKYRRVQLACGDHVLSEADNWYLPKRLTPAMNQQLDHSDVPFGKVVQPLHFRRKTLSAELLWSPLPAGWEMQSASTATSTAPLKIPHLLLQHRALLYAADDRPFSALIETYTERFEFRIDANRRRDPVRWRRIAVSARSGVDEIFRSARSGKPGWKHRAVGQRGSARCPGGWDIWMIRRHHGVWSAPQSVSFNTTAHEFDPAFSADGKTVWFFSNRPGGQGGDDIWSASFDTRSGRFGIPRNAGPAINSAGDEWAPSPSPDGTQLLFATNGRGGRGRHDLFVSTWRDGAWQPAVPLPGEVNTADDDFDATFIDGGRGLVYSRSTDVDNDPVELWFALRGADGGYHAPRRLDDRVNVVGGFAMGPSIDPSQPGVLLFSSKRADANRGRADIYAIRFQLPKQPATTEAH